MELTSLSIYRYELTPKSAPNRLASTGKREGALLRANFKGLAHAGHADLFPWPELGDENLATQLAALREGISFRLGAAALAWAYYEAEAQQKGTPLLSQSSIRMHATLSERSIPPTWCQLAKIKVSQVDIDQWVTLEEYLLQFPRMKWRLDFNGLFQDVESAQRFWQGVSFELKNRIDFLEDPYSLELMEKPKALQIFEGARIAVDRCATPERLKHADVWVIKPVYYNPAYLIQEVALPQQEVVITSNMDHPLGQIIALHTAQLLQKQAPKMQISAGLLTQSLYHPHPQSDWVREDQGQLYPKNLGAGWGLNAELAKLPWEKLA